MDYNVASIHMTTLYGCGVYFLCRKVIDTVSRITYVGSLYVFSESVLVSIIIMQWHIHI